MTAASNLETHDFAVKMLAWSAARGSTLEYRCRRCGRRFHQMTVERRGIWAVDGEGRPLESVVTDRWLSDKCPRLFSVKDDEDRKRLSKVVPA